MLYFNPVTKSSDDNHIMYEYESYESNDKIEVQFCKNQIAPQFYDNDFKYACSCTKCDYQKQSLIDILITSSNKENKPYVFDKCTLCWCDTQLALYQYRNTLNVTCLALFCIRQQPPQIFDPNIRYLCYCTSCKGIQHTVTCDNKLIRSRVSTNTLLPILGKLC